MTRVPSLADILGTAVRVQDVRVGTVTGIVGDGNFDRVVGFEVTGRDGRRRFLPRVGASLQDGVLSMASALVLVDTGELDAYRRQGALVVRDAMWLEGLALDLEGRVRRPAAQRGVSRAVATGTSAM